MELYFYPEKTEEMAKTLKVAKGGEESLYKLTKVISKLKDDLEESKLPKWEVSLKGYIEISSGGLLPGGKAGFEATIKISSP